VRAQLHFNVCKEVGVKLDNKHWYNHAPKSVETNREGKVIARAERDVTRAETRFRLSPKRTCPFKSVEALVQSTAGSRGVRISFSNAG